MPFIHTNEHWQGLRKGVAAVFHTAFMDTYFGHFTAAASRGVERLRANGEVSVRQMLHELTYETACMGLFGQVIDVEVPFAGDDQTVHFRQAQH